MSIDLLIASIIGQAKKDAEWGSEPAADWLDTQGRAWCQVLDVADYDQRIDAAVQKARARKAWMVEYDRARYQKRKGRG